MRPAEPIEARLQRSYTENPITGCWEWSLHRDQHGYGRIAHNGKPNLAHRVVYETLVGRIPAGLTIDHLCRNRCCVNPEHLEPVTLAENSRRGFRPGSLLTHCKHEHPLSGANLYMRPPTKRGGRRQCRACNAAAAARYNIRKGRRTA